MVARFLCRCSPLVRTRGSQSRHAGSIPVIDSKSLERFVVNDGNSCVPHRHGRCDGRAIKRNIRRFVRVVQRRVLRSFQPRMRVRFPSRIPRRPSQLVQVAPVRLITARVMVRLHRLRRPFCKLRPLVGPAQDGDRVPPSGEMRPEPPRRSSTLRDTRTTVR